MESPSSFPTSADYAQSSANTATELTKKLMKRIEVLETAVLKLQREMARLNP